LQKIFNDASFFEGLLKLDRDLAESYRDNGCQYCGEQLHVANFKRKPRGHSAEISYFFNLRFSFCCYKCRKRFTPPSFRYLGRKVYLGTVILLVSALMGRELSPSKLKRLKKLCGANRRTLIRWRKWWQEEFSSTDLWKVLYGQIALNFHENASIPFNILRLQRKGRVWLNRAVKGVLKLLLPLTSGGGPERARYFMVT